MYLAGGAEELDTLAVKMRAGLSTRDIEALFFAREWQHLALAHGGSEVMERLWTQYEAICQSRFVRVEVVYLFIDGIAEQCIAERNRTSPLHEGKS